MKLMINISNTKRCWNENYENDIGSENKYRMMYSQKILRAQLPLRIAEECGKWTLGHNPYLGVP